MNLLGWTEENHEKSQDSRVPTEIRTEHVPNTNLEIYRYTDGLDLEELISFPQSLQANSGKSAFNSAFTTFGRCNVRISIVTVILKMVFPDFPPSFHASAWN
jgi:hypothetical protein